MKKPSLFKLTISAFIILAGFLCFSTVSEAARQVSPSVEHGAGKPAKHPGKPAAVAGQLVQTEFFSVKLPPDWFMPYPLTKKPGGTAAVFSNEKTNVTVNINVLKSDFNAQRFANIIQINMKRDGLNPSAPRPYGKMYRVTLNGKAKGEAFFAADGKLCVATVILSDKSDIRSANAFLSAFQSPVRNMFPANLK